MSLFVNIGEYEDIGYNPASMHRFFIPPAIFSPANSFSPGWIQGERVSLEGEVAHRISRVLRLKAGETIQVLDNRGSEYTILLETVSAGQVSGICTGCQAAMGEPEVQVALYLGLTQREKFEWMLQKCTEAGAAVFNPVICERSLAQKAAEVQAKLPRWQRILQEAAEQSHRGRIPRLEPALSFAEAVNQAHSLGGLVLIPWEGEHILGLRKALRTWVNSWTSALGPGRVAVFIGPEGGFSNAEVDLARRQGAVPVTLGPRILRVETAAVVTTALVLYELGI